MMKTSGRTIGTLAQQANVSVETIRYYERRGLIAQPPTVTGRYRVYSDAILAQLRYIKIAQTLGFSLSDIQKLQGQLSQKPSFCSAIESTVSKKLIAIEDEIRNLVVLRDALDAFQQRCAKRASDDCPLYDELHRLGVAVSDYDKARQAPERQSQSWSS